MKKNGLLLALVCTSALAEPLAQPPARNEGCVAAAPHAVTEIQPQQPLYHRESRRIGRIFFHAQEVKTTPDQAFHQSARMPPYFSGFCNPAFPSSCP